MRRFNASKVKALGNLTPSSEKQKAFARRQRGVKQRFAEDKPDPAFQATRDFLCPMKPGFIPRKPRGRSHVLMGKTSRDAVDHKLAQREAFFRSLCE